MQFARVVEAYEKIEATTKRLEMTDLLVGLLREIPKEDLDKVVYLTQGRIHPDYEGIELGLAEKMVIRVLVLATGLDDARVQRLWKEKGDLGLVAEEALAARRQKPLESTPLTTAKVYANLDAIARESGEGSQDRKIRLLSDLLGNATPGEAKYIVRMVVGQMRLGVADMTIVDALASAYATKADRDRVERAYNVSSDLGEVARAIAAKGLGGLEEIHLKLFRPIRAMLAERLETLEEIFERMGEAALEYKYDGLRVQAHVSPNEIKLFSRHLENITGQFPEIVAGLKAAIRGNGAIVEGEAVPVDPNTGEFLPFQEVSRRRGRKTEVERMAKEFPVTLFAFDCLLRGDEDLTARPYTERRKALEAALTPNEGIRHSTVRVTDDVKQAEAFFDEALQARETQGRQEGPQACASRLETRGRRLVRAANRPRSAGRRNHREPCPHVRVGCSPRGRRTRRAVPPVHGAVARRQGTGRRDDREGTPRDVSPAAQAGEEAVRMTTASRTDRSSPVGGGPSPDP